MIDIASRPTELRGVALPTGGPDILLPSIAMAEVISYHDPTPCPGAPDWLLGTVGWRGCSVPLLSLVTTDGEMKDGVRRQRARVVVCYTPSGNSALPYLGFHTVGLPRLNRMSPGVLEPAQIPPESPMILHGLTVADRPALIPDMDAIEQAVLEVIRA